MEQLFSSTQLQSMLCEAPYIETKINPDDRLLFQCFLFKNILKYLPIFKMEIIVISFQ